MMRFAASFSDRKHRDKLRARSKAAPEARGSKERSTESNFIPGLKPGAPWRNPMKKRTKLMMCMLACATGGGASAAGYKIAVVAPISGSASTYGQDMLRGAQLAAKLREEELKKAGFTVKIEAFDDRGQPSSAANIAGWIKSDRQIMAVVGSILPSVTKRIAEPLSQEGVAVITPAPADAEVLRGNYPNLAMLAAPDVAQAQAGIRYIREHLKLKSLYIVSDQTAGGNSLGVSMRSATAKAGMKVSGYQGISRENVAALVKDIARTRPAAVYYSGGEELGARLVKAMREGGLLMPFIGSASLDTNTFQKIAGKAAENVSFTTVYGPVMQMPGAGAFSARYQAAYSSGPSGLAAYAFDSANIAIDALKRNFVGSKGKPNRTGVLREILATSLKQCQTFDQDCHNGSGAISFNKQGIRKVTRLYVMEYAKGAWLLGQQQDIHLP